MEDIAEPYLACLKKVLALADDASMETLAAVYGRDVRAIQQQTFRQQMAVVSKYYLRHARRLRELTSTTRAVLLPCARVRADADLKQAAPSLVAMVSTWTTRPADLSSPPTGRQGSSSSRTAGTSTPCPAERHPDGAPITQMLRLPPRRLLACSACGGGVVPRT